MKSTFHFEESSNSKHRKDLEAGTVDHCQWYEKKAMETLSYKNCASVEILEVIDKINIIIIINIHI